MMRILRILSRIFVGIVFVFSGFVKAIDPLGSTYKFTDYFNAFNIGFLEPLAFPLAVLLSSMELIIGISLLLAYRLKVISWFLLVFMSFFTLLTFILALTNPVHDCGCFGDALILTNWQTFWKNVVLMVFTLVVFIYRKHFPVIRRASIEWSVLILFFLGAIFLSLYCYNNLPLIDFRPYKVGTNIPEAMSIPEGAPENQYDTRLFYENKETGEQHEFSMENFPRDTSEWEFVDAVTVLVSEGYEPAIHDFNIMAADGSEITDSITLFRGYSFLLISHDAGKAELQGLEDANRFFRLAQTLPDIQFYAISSTLREDLDSLRKNLNLEYDFAQADEITLKTIIRSNPGLLLIKNGTIIAKWPGSDFPDEDYFPEFSSILEDFPFCSGCDLQEISKNPSGSPPDIYETKLYYRNLENDSIYEFSIENFPNDTEEWEFENSVSQKLKSGFENPVTRIRFTSADDIPMHETALFNDAYSLIFILKDPSGLSEDEFRSLNKLGGMASDYLGERVDVFPVTAMDSDEIREFTRDHISPFDYYSGNVAWINDLLDESLRIVLIRNGKVIFNWQGNQIPEPSILQEVKYTKIEEAEAVIKPVILSDNRMISEKRLVYIFIFCFLLLALMLRIFLNHSKTDAK